MLCKYLSVTYVASQIFAWYSFAPGSGNPCKPCLCIQSTKHEVVRFNCIFTLHVKLSGAVYCYRSCLSRAGGWRVFVGLLP